MVVKKSDVNDLSSRKKLIDHWISKKVTLCSSNCWLERWEDNRAGMAGFCSQPLIWEAEPAVTPGSIVKILSLDGHFWWGSVPSAYSVSSVPCDFHYHPFLSKHPGNRPLALDKLYFDKSSYLPETLPILLPSTDAVVPSLAIKIYAIPRQTITLEVCRGCRNLSKAAGKLYRVLPNPVENFWD